MNKYKGAFPGAFALTAFSIASPTALKKYDADNGHAERRLLRVQRVRDRAPDRHRPVHVRRLGQGEQEITLDRNPDYWGDKAKVDKLIIKIIKDENTRKQELRAGTVQGYRLPGPGRPQGAGGRGLQGARPARRSTSSTWASTRRTTRSSKDLRVRQAIAYALNRAAAGADQGPGRRQGRRRVHAGHGARLRPGRQKYELQPGQGQAAAGRGRRRRA